MIEEYARHNGHADLIRELADGSVGCWAADAVSGPVRNREARAAPPHLA